MVEDPVNLQFLGEQIKRVQGDMRVLKGDVAQLRAGNSKLEGEVAGLKADITRVDMRLDAFAESVSDRFDQLVELIKSSFRGLDQKIDRADAKIDTVASDLSGMVGKVDAKVDRVDAKVDALKQ